MLTSYNNNINILLNQGQTINAIFPVRFYSRNKSVRLLGRSDNSQQTAMPTVTRVVSILNFTTFQNGDTTFYRQISRKHRFQRLCRYILSDFQGFTRIYQSGITQRVICPLFATVSRIRQVVEEVRIQPLLPLFSFLCQCSKI